MRAHELYSQLNKAFIKPGMSDNWVADMSNTCKLLSKNFLQCEMGVVYDWATDVTQAYTAVFPSETVLLRLIERDVKDTLLFVHHPMIWNICEKPVYREIALPILEEMQARRIAIYNLHVPLDHFGAHGTSKTLAEAVGLTVEKPFCPYHGALAGVICASPYRTVTQLQAAFSKALGFETTRYPYGDEEIANGRVAVVAGGGNDYDTVQGMRADGASTLITGVSVRNEVSESVHRFEEEHHINLLGGTHYATEQFACRSMCAWFEALGIPCEFLPDTPQKEDM